MTITMCATTASAICLRYGGKYISSCPDRDSSTGWRPRGESAPAKKKTGTGGGREEERGEQRSALLPLLQYTHPPTHTYFLSVQILFPRDVPAFLWDSPGMKIPGPNSEALRSFPFGLLRCPFLVCVCGAGGRIEAFRRLEPTSPSPPSGRNRWRNIWSPHLCRKQWRKLWCPHQLHHLWRNLWQPHLRRNLNRRLWQHLCSHHVCRNLLRNL